MTKRPMSHPKVVGAIQSKSKESHSLQRQSFSTEQNSNRIKKLLVLPPVHFDATSWYRAAGPMGSLRDKDWRVTIKKGEGIDWTDVMENDVVFMQRPYQRDHWECAQVCASLGKPIWIDYDDNLFALPESNGAYLTYNNDETQAMLAKIIQIATVITVSTEALRDEILKRFPNKAVLVMPNAWNDFVHRWPKREYKQHKRFIWRGGPSHKEDIEAYLPAFGTVAEMHPDWEFWFVGDSNFRLKKYIPANRLIEVTQLQTIVYFNWLRSVEAGVGLVPLADHSFNECKSNIAWQEFTHAGLATVAPDWKEWNTAPNCVAQYGKEISFVEAVTYAVENGETLYNNSWQAIQEKRLLSFWNRNRLNLLNSLVR